MRLAFYHNQPPGGARRVLYGFGRELARRHEIDVFTPATADDRMLHDSDYARSVERLDFAPRAFVRMGFYLNDRRRIETLDDLEEVNAEAAARIDAGGYDAVLVDTCQFTFTPQVLRHLRTPALHYCHHGSWRAEDVDGGSGRSPYEAVRSLLHAPFEREYMTRLRRQDRELAGRATAVATNSAYTAGRLLAATGVRATVCPPGVNLPLPRGNAVGEHILAVGDFVPHKGHELVVEALGRVPRRGRLPLHIVGNGEGRHYEARLARLAAERGVDLTIRVGVSEAELEDEFERALLFASGSRREPLGLAPLEAMARGLAVVAVGEGGVKETVVDGQTGFLVAPDAGAMGERLARLIDDASLRDRMGAAGRDEVEARWTWPGRARALEGLLVAVAGGRPAEVAG
jgi:glycosyltransferase involved in cell wall biosynthesis